MKKIKKSYNVIVWVIFALLVIGSVSGVRTYYHFYWAPTGVVLKETGKEVNRVELIDMVLDMVVQQNAIPQTPNVTPGSTSFTHEHDGSVHEHVIQD